LLKTAIVPYFKVLFRQGLSKTTIIVRRSGRQSNPGLPECEAGIVKNYHSVRFVCRYIWRHGMMNRRQFDGRVQLANGYRLVFVTALSCNVACTCQSSRYQSDVSVNDRSYVPKSVCFAVHSLPGSWACLRAQL